jgi:hypothetical protein
VRRAQSTVETMIGVTGTILALVAVASWFPSVTWAVLDAVVGWLEHQPWFAGWVRAMEANL